MEVIKTALTNILLNVYQIKILGLVVPLVATPLFIAGLFILAEKENFYQSVNKQNVDTGAYTYDGIWF